MGVNLVKNIQKGFLTVFLILVLTSMAYSISIINSSVVNCSAEDAEAVGGSFVDSCDNVYPGSALLYDDAQNESHQIRKQGGNVYWAGIKTLSLDENVSCDKVESVEFCYKWWSSTTGTQNCYVSVDSNGGANYSRISGTCPGSTEPAGETCVNVTVNESWSCESFFGSSSTGVLAKSEIQHDRTGPNGYFDVFWDVFYFKVVKNSFPEIQLNSPADGASGMPVNQTLNVTVSDGDEDAVEVSFYNASDDSIICSYLGVASGSSVTCDWNSLKLNSTYFWYVNATDGSETTQSSVWNFTTTEGNLAPTINHVELKNDPLAPGVIQEINVTVTDKGGFGDIASVNLTIWNREISSEKSSDDWDHYTLSNGTWDAVSVINSTTSKYVFSQQVSQHALNGTYSVKANAEDKGTLTDSKEINFTVLTRTGIVLDTLILTVSGKAGREDVAFNENPQNITHDGNIKQNIYINGTVLSGPETIGVGNVTYSDLLGTPNEYSMTQAKTLFGDVSPMNRGTYPNPSSERVYYWLDYPVGTKTGTYTGTIVINAG